MKRIKSIVNKIWRRVMTVKIEVDWEDSCEDCGQAPILVVSGKCVKCTIKDKEVKDLNKYWMQK